jgi:transcriptional regulator with XRE-family HTH domain
MIGARLKALREESSRSQEYLAGRADVSVQLISRIENGSANPTLGTLYAIVDALGVPIESLFKKSSD